MVKVKEENEDVGEKGEFTFPTTNYAPSQNTSMERVKEESKDGDKHIDVKHEDFTCTASDYMSSRIGETELERPSSVKEEPVDSQSGTNLDKVHSVVKMERPDSDNESEMGTEQERPCPVLVKEEPVDLNDESEEMAVFYKERMESLHIKEEIKCVVKEENNVEEQIFGEVRRREDLRRGEETAYDDPDTFGCKENYSRHQTVSGTSATNKYKLVSLQEAHEERGVHHSSALLLKQHMKPHAKEMPCKCTVCSEGYSKKGNLTKHGHMYGEGGQQTSDDQLVQQEREDKTTEIVERHPRECLFECSDCGKRFKKKSGLVVHIKIHAPVRLFVCKICKLSYTDKYSFTQHNTENHPQEKPHTCAVCAKGFSNISQLNRHRIVHTGKKPFKCNICGRSFADWSNWKRHSIVHTGERSFLCHDCGKCFSTNYELKTHSRKHTGEKPFQCSVCGKCFIASSALRQHCVLHTNERPFKCSICGKGFTQSGDLNKHSHIHTMGRPFTCSVCGRGFSDSDSLNMHNCVHKKKRPFKCTVCGKGFIASCDLKKHSVVHTNERPFKCSVCGKAFKHSSHLKRHSHVHTEKEPL